ILLINNSVANYSEENGSWQGVLHTATVCQPSDEQRRIVNSMMMASVHLGTEEPVSAAEQLRFVEWTVVHRRGYDKPLLADDV
ncbi:MAG: hypothetical protein K8T25_04435, partial [Planctomycetia bacterium]|nr:hypothetical protein [Planctomycetia bacterium]